MCLGATLDVAGPGGPRQVSADDFFVGAMTTALGPADVLTSVRIPLPGSGESFGFSEIARRHGDFALAGVAVRVRGNGGAIHGAHVTSFGVADRPQRRDLGGALAEAIARSDGSGEDLAARLTDATDAMAADVVTTGGDSNGSPAYRRRLIRTLAARTLARAYTSTLRSSAA